MATPLKDCVIALSGKLDETHAKIGALIKKNGGKHSTKVSGEEEGWWVTHLVTTAKHIEAQAEKVQEASKFPDIKIVNFDWLTTSINSQLRADEAQFSFDQTPSSPDDTTSSMGPTNSKQNGSRGKGQLGYGQSPFHSPPS